MLGTRFSVVSTYKPKFCNPSWAWSGEARSSHNWSYSQLQAPKMCVYCIPKNEKAYIFVHAHKKLGLSMSKIGQG